MTQVYQLHRDVALKVLPGRKTADSLETPFQRPVRFQPGGRLFGQSSRA